MKKTPHRKKEISTKELLRDEIWMDDLNEGGDPLWAMAYPASYAVGMSNLGFQYVCAYLKEHGVAVERFFDDNEQERSLESGRLAGNFPIITFSVMYEPDVKKILQMLKRWGISPLWRERQNNLEPIIGVGGGLSVINPLIFSHIADFVVLGDGEDVIPYLVNAVRRYSQKGNRRIFWESVAEHPSLFVPPLHLEMLQREEIISRKKSFCMDLSKARGHALWVSPNTVFPDTLLIETQRGCFRRCPYCTIPSCFGKPRFRKPEGVINDVRGAYTRGIKRLGIVAPESGDYPWLEEVLKEIRKNNLEVSFASLRIDNINDMLLDTLVEGGQRQITIAPETGDQTFRSSCGKHFTNEQILSVLQKAKGKGLKKVKMYFMLGLPEEEDRHILATADLIAEVREKTGMNVVASVGLFVPKPQTPWSGMSFSHAEYKRKVTLLRGAIGNIKGVEMRVQSVREARDEYRITWTNVDNFLDYFVTNTAPVREKTVAHLEALGF